LRCLKNLNLNNLEYKQNLSLSQEILNKIITSLNKLDLELFYNELDQGLQRLAIDEKDKLNKISNIINLIR